MATERSPLQTAGLRPVRRVAMIVVHSHPLDEPGSGDAGGMTVYVREVARALANGGVEVDIYTRRGTAELPANSELFEGVRIIQVDSGPPTLRKDELPAHLPEFTANLLRLIEAQEGEYDLIHSHYWLSGKVAARVARRLGIPFVHTFHTLGKAKGVEEPEGRLIGEARVIVEADAIIASTPDERCWLIDLYAAHPERIHIIPPGVDHDLFIPADRAEAKDSLGLEGKQVLLFVGRLQPLKAADTAVRALAHLVDWGRLDPERSRLLIVGGPSGGSGSNELERLHALAEELGVSQSVEFIPAQPHRDLPRFYQAADVCLVPSHTETFGLVALEAQACGVPVVASSVGGLRSIVHHGQTGFLVEPASTEAFAERTWRVLSDERAMSGMSSLAICSSREYSWDRSASELYGLYVASVAEHQDANKVFKPRRKLSRRY